MNWLKAMEAFVPDSPYLFLLRFYFFSFLSWFSSRPVAFSNKVILLIWIILDHQLESGQLLCYPMAGYALIKVKLDWI